MTVEAAIDYVKVLRYSIVTLPCHFFYFDAFVLVFIVLAKASSNKYGKDSTKYLFDLLQSIAWY